MNEVKKVIWLDDCISQMARTAAIFKDLWERNYSIHTLFSGNNYQKSGSSLYTTKLHISEYDEYIKEEFFDFCDDQQDSENYNQAELSKLSPKNSKILDYDFDAIMKEIINLAGTGKSETVVALDIELDEYDKTLKNKTMTMCLYYQLSAEEKYDDTNLKNDDNSDKFKVLLYSTFEGEEQKREKWIKMFKSNFENFEKEIRMFDRDKIIDLRDDSSQDREAFLENFT